MAIRTKERVPLFSHAQLEAIAKVLGDTQSGFTGSEIKMLLSQAKIPDTAPASTKWRRLFDAFACFQNEHRLGNHVVSFIDHAMAPARYTADPAAFCSRRTALNQVLVFSGLELGDDGRIRRVQKAATISEALARANRFKEQLRQRGVHEDVLGSCAEEIEAENYFHTVLEAMKSVTAKIRKLSGRDGDGQRFVDEVFGFNFGERKPPILAINALDTKSKQGEQRGFSNLLKGLYGTVRNPIAHEPKTEWPMSEQDALDIMGMISLVHRKLDGAHATSPKGSV